MLKDRLFHPPYRAYFSLPVYIIVFVLGLQFSYYLIFSSLAWYDDEGTMLLYFRAFFEDTRSYDSIILPYGPFHILLKHGIYRILDADVSHDTNRLVTIVFWGLIAAVTAFFVHRVTRSLILAAIVQVMLIFHLAPLKGSAGVAQETALLLIAFALLLSSYVGSQRHGLLSRVGLGVALGALLLVKINIGVYLGLPIALSMLFFLPRHTLVRCLLILASLVAVALPTVIMSRHSLLPIEDRNYGISVTFVIVAGLIAASRRNDDAQLQWADVGITVSAMFLCMAGIVAIIVAWGGSAQAIADQSILRALKQTTFIHSPLLLPDFFVYTSIGSVFLALFYRFVFPKIGNNDSRVLLLSLVKLVYGCFVLHSLNGFPSSAVLNPSVLLYLAISVSFLWIVLVEPYGDLKPALGHRFPRVFLCLSAAFQILQAYPVAGAQRSWAVFLLLPLAAICIGDTLPIFWAEIKRRWPEKIGRHSQQRLYATFMALLICLVGVWSYQKANIGRLKAEYAALEPLDLPGARNIRLPKQDALNMRALVTSIRSHCDGFVGLPGNPSLYFWTQMRPPGFVPDYWVIEFEEVLQHEIISNMEKYGRPCIVYNPAREMFWLLGAGQSEDSKMPLVKYIRSRFTEIQKYGNYSLLMKKERGTPLQ